MRHFRQLPEGVDLENMLPIQGDFLMLLVAAAPSLEAMKSWLHYQEEREKILQTDFSAELTTPEDMMSMLARMKGMSLEAYKKECTKELQEIELEKLDKQYGIKPGDDEEIDERSQILQKYGKVAEQLENNPEVKKLASVDEFFSKPGNKDA